MRNEIVWEVDAAAWDAICETTELLDNAAISQQDYLEKLRALGMPHGARPGANLRVVLTPRRIISVPTLAKLNGGVLPGLPRGTLVR